MQTPSPPRENEKNARLLRRLLGLALQYRGACVGVFALQVVLLGLGLSGLGLGGLAIDVIRHELDPGAPAPRWPFGIEPPAGSPRALLFVIGALVLGMAGARALLNYAYSVQVGKLMHLRLVPELRARVFDKLQRLSFRFFDANASGSIINRVTGDVQSVRAFVDGVLLQGAIMLLSLGVYLVYMLETHVGLSLACLAFMPALWWLTAWFSARARPEYEKNRALMDDLVLAMSEGVHGIQVTKVFGREAEELERFRRKNRAVLEQQTAIFRRVSRFTPGVGFITHLDTAILLLYGGSLVSRQVLTLGELIVFAGLMQQFSGQITSMAGIVNTLQQSLAGARRVFEVLDAPIEVAAPATPRRLGRARGRVRFEHVSFAYEAGRRVLDDLNFEVPPGASLAIFGATGAGKSTLISLVPRFFDVSQGRVLVDGHDVRELDLDELRRRVGVVFQESLLFHCSVAENIAFGYPDASREAIERAARLACAHEFISALPDGYDTVLAEGAVNLSGGQRQRIAIARALLLEPSILLLDDPTSAVDSETEHEVLTAMQRAMAGRTTLIVGNRVSTVKGADRILVLERGRVVESGTHAELLEQRGLYFRTAALQLGEREASAVGEGVPA
ncbi:MAG TPA: ABC transporter ATP-binding protein [Polyangiaceae bacterium]|nr:ABC transporter ATP-binding protein [Polyangiaceae bacterium]